MKKNILVVDDNAINQKVLIRMVQTLGYDALGAFDGEEAISKLNEEKISLVLMDCNMPVMDGYVTTQRIREMESSGMPEINITASNPIPIIALTADAMSGVHEKCIAAGMNDYLTKPVDLILLGKTISSHLKKE
ncbi:MAG: response regulator [Gammaproteobacteria bacterium]|nr:response regulator [Gammaproteobacteria bacterium]MDH5594030.1 response regulator [Gammaproteobacteria bacterium]